jgi:hypothetical protein
VQLLVVVAAHVQNGDPVAGRDDAGHRVHQLGEDAAAVGIGMHPDETDVVDPTLGEALGPPLREVLRGHERHRLDHVRDRAEPLKGSLRVEDQVLVDPGVGHDGVELPVVHHVPLHGGVPQRVERLEIELPGLLAQVIGDDLHRGD